MSISNFPPFISNNSVQHERFVALRGMPSLRPSVETPRPAAMPRIDTPRQVAIPRTVVADVSVRGTPFAPVQAFVRSQFKEGGWQHFKTLLSPEARDAVTQPVIATNWYPFPVALSVVEGLVGLAEGRTSVLRDFAIHNLDYATNVVFRAIFKMGSPQFMVARSDQVWKKYYTNGRMVCDVVPTRSRIELRDFPYLSASYEKLLLHSIEAVLLKAGARLKRLAVTKSTLQGDKFTEFTHEWV